MASGGRKSPEKTLTMTITSPIRVPREDQRHIPAEKKNPHWGISAYVHVGIYAC